jgi:hypothetical protein
MVADALAFGRALREQVVDDGDGICCDELVSPAPPHHRFAALFYPPRRFRFAQPNGPEHVCKVSRRQIGHLSSADLREGIVANRVDPLVDVLAVPPCGLQLSMDSPGGFFESEGVSTGPHLSALGSPLVNRVLVSCDQLARR